jgi:integrase
MVVCLLYTGCRLSEMIRLKEKDVNWTDRRLKVRDTKNGDPIRVIPMTQKVEKELNELMLVQGNTAPFSAHKRSFFSYHWNKARNFAGYSSHQGFKIHCLRHTCATRLLKAGVHVEVVKEWLGHSSIEMTMRYYRFQLDDLDKARDKLQGF